MTTPALLSNPAAKPIGLGKISLNKFVSRSLLHQPEKYFWQNIYF